MPLPLYELMSSYFNSPLAITLNFVRFEWQQMNLMRYSFPHVCFKSFFGGGRVGLFELHKQEKIESPQSDLRNSSIIAQYLRNPDILNLTMRLDF